MEVARSRILLVCGSVSESPLTDMLEGRYGCPSVDRRLNYGEEVCESCLLGVDCRRRAHGQSVEQCAIDDKWRNACIEIDVLSTLRVHCRTLFCPPFSSQLC